MDFSNPNSYFKIPVGYLMTLEEIASDEPLHLPLDLTYKTIRNLPGALAYVYSGGAVGTREDRAVLLYQIQ